jgi:hypothetical protein
MSGITRHCGRLAATVILAAPAVTHAQSFNIDLGPTGAAAPPDSYGGAGRSGHWMKIPGTSGVTVFDLVDVNGATTPARLVQIGGTETLALSDPAVEGDHATLMNDVIITHTTTENCIFMSSLIPGDYEVIVYARMPAMPEIVARTRVDEEAGMPPSFVGGEWTGDHALLVSHSIHVATVAASGPQAGRLGLHSGVPAGGDFGIGAALNALQVRRIVDVPGDVDGDEEVGFTDLLAILAAWGPCPAPCDADLDGSGSVGFEDLLEVLTGWTA